MDRESMCIEVHFFRTATPYVVSKTVQGQTISPFSWNPAPTSQWASKTKEENPLGSEPTLSARWGQASNVLPHMAIESTRDYRLNSGAVLLVFQVIASFLHLSSCRYWQYIAFLVSIGTATSKHLKILPGNRSQAMVATALASPSCQCWVPVDAGQLLTQLQYRIAYNEN